MKKRRNKKVTPMTLTRHHILPTSRGKRRATHKASNIAMIEDRYHKAYHILFSNMTPDEIINHLVDKYWNGQEHWLYDAIIKREED